MCVYGHVAVMVVHKAIFAEEQSFVSSLDVYGVRGSIIHTAVAVTSLYSRPTGLHKQP